MCHPIWVSGGGASSRAWGTTCLCSFPASAAQKWSFLSPLRGAHRTVRAIEAPYGPMAACGDLWGPMGTYGGLWGPIGANGDLWGPMGAYGDLWGPIGAYGDLWGGGHQLFAHPFGHEPPPPFLQAADLYQTYHTSCCIHRKNNMPHQTSDFIHTPAMALSRLFSWA